MTQHPLVQPSDTEAGSGASAAMALPAEEDEAAMADAPVSPLFEEMTTSLSAMAVQDGPEKPSDEGTVVLANVCAVDAAVDKEEPAAAGQATARDGDLPDAKAGGAVPSDGNEQALDTLAPPASSAGAIESAQPAEAAATQQQQQQQTVQPVQQPAQQPAPPQQADDEYFVRHINFNGRTCGIIMQVRRRERAEREREIER
jgi:hypothetical protein